MRGIGFNLFDGIGLMTRRPSFAITAILYTIGYATAVAIDHGTTVLALRAGAIEANVFLQGPGGSLASHRALITLALVFPLMLWLLWLADCRRRTRSSNANWFSAQIIGRTPEAAARLPLVVIFAKSFAAVSNALIVFYGFSIFRPVRMFLEDGGIESPAAQFVIGGLVFLLPAVWVSNVIARWLYQDDLPRNNERTALMNAAD